MSEEDAERQARRALSVLVEPGDADAGAAVAAIGAVTLWAMVTSGQGLADLRDVMEAAGEDAYRMPAAWKRWRPRVDRVDLDDQQRRADRAEARFIVPGDAAWPGGWDDLGDHAPLGAWVRGDASALTARPGVAMVGARAATGYGEHMTAEVVGDLASFGATIVSGAAYGIDGAAHRSALATGMTTVAVLAGGADRVYPAGHAALLGGILRSGGAVVSEMPPGSEPTRWRFLARNRLIAAMSAATVVVEAGWRSGSLNTAGHAAALARPLGAVPGPVTSAASAGCHRLLREYDAVCVTTGAEVAELAGLASVTAGGDDIEDASGLARRVIDSLSARVPRDRAEIAVRAGAGFDEVAAVLGLLELDGLVVRVGEGWCAPGR